MILKALEMQGFKSFPDKTLLEFNKCITAVVGPNGSGKSNVGDAVRWVLGEQSARQLRGSNMQDVIFSGTENRKPLGFASVSITLDNADHKLPVDYEEVTVGQPPRLPLRRERISLIRYFLPAERYSGDFLRHRYRKRGLLHHRPGTD